MAGTSRGKLLGFGFDDATGLGFYGVESRAGPQVFLPTLKETLVAGQVAIRHIAQPG
jgi:hypothetical protein